jgi:adenylate cyclase
MAQEIEKKFLLLSDAWRDLGQGEKYCQGYISSEKGRTVRVRTIADRGILTIKGPSKGDSRLEFEYPVPLAEAREMLEKLCHKPLIEKTRYTIPVGPFTWEVDEFIGENQGLIFAEIELEYVGQSFEIPDWIGEEVTGDHRYYNANLVNNPYCHWKK